jgi:hypothetical protein
MVVPWADSGDTADAAFRSNPSGKPMAGALLRAVANEARSLGSPNHAPDALHCIPPLAFALPFLREQALDSAYV